MKNKILLFLIIVFFSWPFSGFTATNTATKEILRKVPFSSQAPYGNWKDQRQQDGCEEISSLMAIKWANNQSLTKDEALKEVLGISDWEKKKYGEYRDISASSTLNWIIYDYFNYKNAKLKTNASLNDIINELKKGK